MASIFDKVRQKVSDLTKTVKPTVQKYADAYSKVSPYIPFAPQIVTPQQIQRNDREQIVPILQGAKNFYQGFTEQPQTYNNALADKSFAYKAGKTFGGMSPVAVDPIVQTGTGLVRQIPRAVQGLQTLGKVDQPIFSLLAQQSQRLAKGMPEPYRSSVELGFGMTFGGARPISAPKVRILSSDVRELERAKNIINTPLTPRNKINLDKFQEALDFMSDLKNSLKLKIPDKQWNAMSADAQHQALYSYIRDIYMSGQNFGLAARATGDVMKAEKSKAENFIKDLPDVRKKVNLIDYLRTPSKVLEKIGLKNEAKQLDAAHFNYEQELKGEIKKIANWYSQAPNPQSAVNIFKYLDGQNVPLAPNELKVAQEIKTYLSRWADRLGLPQDKRIANYITHIFEKGIIKKEFDPEIAKIISDKVPSSVYDPFLQSRLGKLGYKENVWEALEAYIKRATRKVNMDPALAQLSKAADKLDVESWNYVKKLGDRINMRPTEIDNLIDNLVKSSPIGYRLGQRPTNLITSKFRQMIYRSTLGLNISSAMKNLTQGANTYAELGEKYTARGYFDLVRKGTQELNDNGIFSDAIIQDKDIHILKKFMSKVDDGLFSLFDFAEKVNRGSAYFGAKAKALDKGMSEQQAIKYARDIVAKTQFRFSNIDTPLALSSDIAKTLAQFQSFGIKQIEFLSGKIKNKELGGLLRYTLATVVFANTVGKLFGHRLQDMIPTLRFESPLINALSTGSKLLSTDENKRAEGKREAVKQSKLVIPAGVQLEKTLTGLRTVNQGFSESPTGKYEYPDEKSSSAMVRAGLFGKHNLPEAREYYGEKRKPLSENQAARAKALGKEQYYKELGGRYKDDAIQAYLVGDYQKAGELQKKYNLTIKKKELTNAVKKQIIEAYFSGDYKTAGELQAKHNIKVSAEDMASTAKKEAIRLYLQGRYAETGALQKKFNLKITKKDIYGE